jgi:hypothetical protein
MVVKPVHRLDEAEKQLMIVLEELDLDPEDAEKLAIARGIVAALRDTHMPDHEDPTDE